MSPRRSALAAALLLGGAALAGAAPPRESPASPPSAAPSASGAARWRVLDLTPPSPPPAVSATASPISLSVRDADLVEVVRSLVRIAGLNLVVDPGVRGTVTAELRDVPWDRALAVILKTQGLAMELDGRVVVVASPSRFHVAP
jgi:type II secretory pathway component HofQ